MQLRDYGFHQPTVQQRARDMVSDGGLVEATRAAKAWFDLAVKDARNEVQGASAAAIIWASILEELETRF